MITILARLLHVDKLPSDKGRSAYGKLCGGVGIVLNILLFIGKFVAGILSHSIAITADAFNNLSDAGSSVVTLVGFKLAEQKPDSDHPFGHGRMEYITGFIVDVIIILVGFELLKGSIEKIISPSMPESDAFTIIILVLSIIVKLWLFIFYRKIGKTVK
jgi:cation diffusion facilitator family transporter